MKRACVFLVVILVNNLVFSQWSTNTVINNSICVAPFSQDYQKTISDGNGGAIICWWQASDVYIQRINAVGVIQWTLNGIRLTDNEQQAEPFMISDGNGGAILAWNEYISGLSTIKVQRVNAGGNIMWPSEGVLICNASNSQGPPRLATDGNGGAIIVWADYRSNNGNVIYAQRVNANGALQWVYSGIPLTAMFSINQEFPRITADSNGGAIICWEEGLKDILAQKVNSAGIIQWGNTGVVICNAVEFQERSEIISGQANGAIITWQDRRAASIHLYAQRVNDQGIILWATNGTRLAPGLNATQQFQKMMTDGNGGSIVTWNGSANVYAQMINASGAIQWGINGFNVGFANSPTEPDLVTDGSGGAIIAWSRLMPWPEINDIYAQRISPAAVKLWDPDGVVICNAEDFQRSVSLVAASSGGAIIDWVDARNSATSGSDLYAQRINSNGTLGGAVLPVTLLNFEAKNINDKVQLHWQTASEQNSHYFSIEKSADGRQFTMIGNVTAAGNTQQLQNYYFTDNVPFNGNNYYRLKQVDVDRRFTYSNVVRISYDERDLLFTLSPNPTYNLINITYPGKSKKLIVSMYDAQGKLAKCVTLQPTGNVLPIMIDVKELEPGIYFIYLNDGETQQKGKFIKY